MTSANDQPQWFTVLMALRWPLALVAAAAILGGVVLRVTSRPLQVALVLDRPLPVQADVSQLALPVVRVQELANPIKIQAQDLVSVRGAVEIASKDAIPITGQPRIVLDEPVAIKAGAPLPVRSEVVIEARQPLPVRAEVEALRPLPVKGEVDVAAEAPLNVNSSVTLETDDTPVQIEFHKRLRSIF
ncbi:hypothetical protein [Cyanobium sp. CH-040]|uniref:hypothetical protein n=1 Tax=Cyanobium sp. CH-040 TaxID=2823708 RepID=UPI0020CEFBCD|nr:hypothetical protein [Cyanobium sp. CH-040]MCP9928895.1 hypothetical protein [Cyanobium sp. CH-040]